MQPLAPDNPVVVLCVAGIAAEGAGKGDEAAALYRRAWDTASDDLERSAAAHYLARVQATDEARLRWNRTALGHALSAGKRAASFLPSLYLNLGHSEEERGNVAAALAAYAAAHRALARDADPALAESLRPAVVRAAQRLRRARRSA